MNLLGFTLNGVPLKNSSIFSSSQHVAETAKRLSYEGHPVTNMDAGFSPIPRIRLAASGVHVKCRCDNFVIACLSVPSTVPESSPPSICAIVRFNMLAAIAAQNASNLSPCTKTMLGLRAQRSDVSLTIPKPTESVIDSTESPATRVCSSYALGKSSLTIFLVAPSSCNRCEPKQMISTWMSLPLSCEVNNFLKLIATSFSLLQSERFDVTTHIFLLSVVSIYGHLSCG
mmetsp:Transcript_13581/g.59283  ORF Transcript_13581/g.59283 Transcript_13581/m.59283 type:complete len:229 (+) Transcript_13581:1742-2428(+)